MEKLKKISVLVLICLFAFTTQNVVAQNSDASSDFSLQVSPSPLVQQLKPGEVQAVELRIRNAGKQLEKLKIEPRKFKVDGESGEVKLDNEPYEEVLEWVSFNDPSFSVQPGEWFTERIRFNTPNDAGFSYAFALVISRESPTIPEPGQTAIEGSVAVFTLLPVDKEGATRSFAVDQFIADKKLYEYLPTELTLKVKNTGNTLVQPAGNIFIQRGGNDQKPITVLPLNETGSYLLPETSRKLKINWTDGFPAYQIDPETGKRTNKLKWEWNKLASLRIGKYTAKVVAIYSDGQRDVPVEASVSFWVFPWKILLVTMLVVGLSVTGFIATIKKTITKKSKDA